jgi:hypothetical protein
MLFLNHFIFEENKVSKDNSPTVGSLSARAGQRERVGACVGARVQKQLVLGAKLSRPLDNVLFKQAVLSVILGVIGRKRVDRPVIQKQDLVVLVVVGARADGFGKQKISHFTDSNLEIF